jgi:hypothetical protein
MKNRTLKLANKFKILAREYASQANAILGIRDSGKTYTAMKAAEELLEAKIPIIVYDPVGIWKNLRSGTKGHKGYPVIVAGGDDSADIILTPENAVQIIRAALKAGVSIIFDLYSPSLANKSKWIKIVQETLDVLMYENKEYGLRHVFAEEASEFIPQRIMPQQSKVYSSFERLARMGRNSSVGMTIINQRAEEVNKAVLELCALIFLHKQVGKNSLLSIEKWMKAAGVHDGEDAAITHHLPKMKQGECIIVDTNGDLNGRIIKILPKHTYHPSPEKGLPARKVKSTVNISQFVKKLNALLSTPEEKRSKKTAAAITQPVSKKEDQQKITDLQKDNLNLRKQLELANKNLNQEKTLRSKLIHEYKSLVVFVNNHVSDLKKMADQTMKHIIKNYNNKILLKAPRITDPVKSSMGAVSKIGKTYQAPAPARTPAPERNTSADSLSGKFKLIKVVSANEGISKPQLALICGMSPNSGTYGVYYRQLRSEGLIEDRDGKFWPTSEGIKISKNWADIPQSTDDILATWSHLLGAGSGMTRILMTVAENRWEWITTEALLSATGMTNSGTFGVYYRKLRALGLIDINKGQFKLSDNLHIGDE